eukprot:6491847-Amphidinium_carterae.4
MPASWFESFVAPHLLAASVGASVAEDQPWASTETNGNIQVASGDMCLACHSLYQRAFSHMSWDEFCDENNVEVQKGKTDARAVINDPTGGRPYPLQVDGHVKYGFEITKDFFVASESELKKHTKQSKGIPKKHLEQLHRVCIGDEEVYVFSDPSQPFRRGRLTLASTVDLTEHALEVKDVLWQGQAQSFYDKKVESEQTTSGLAALAKASR